MQVICTTAPPPHTHAACSLLTLKLKQGCVNQLSRNYWSTSRPILSFPWSCPALLYLDLLYIIRISNIIYVYSSAMLPGIYVQWKLHCQLIQSSSLLNFCTENNSPYPKDQSTTCGQSQKQFYRWIYVCVCVYMYACRPMYVCACAHVCVYAICKPNSSSSSRWLPWWDTDTRRTTNNLHNVCRCRQYTKRCFLFNTDTKNGTSDIIKWPAPMPPPEWLTYWSLIT